MTDQYRRVSVNTILRDANIFDDDSSVESLSDIVERITQEREDPWEPRDLFDKAAVKTEVLDETKVKQEVFDESDIKREVLDDTVYIKQEVTSSISTLIKQEFDNDSPLKTERIDFETKLKFEDKSDIKIEPTRREQARSNILKRRNVPFDNSMSGSESEENGVSPMKKRYFETERTDEEDNRKSKSTAKDKRIKRRNRYVESDSEVLRRRQKQVDYGKNTVGYTKYLEMIPREKRSEIDPQTPDKHRKYSRRGWDGLIKQWRLKLHNYDPEENA